MSTETLKLCLSEHCMVHYGLNMIELAFGTQYKIVILFLLTYLGPFSGLGLENAGLEFNLNVCWYANLVQMTERSCLVPDQHRPSAVHRAGSYIPTRAQTATLNRSTHRHRNRVSMRVFLTPAALPSNGMMPSIDVICMN